MDTANGALVQLLDIKPGISAIVGSGGKSTLLKVLGRELMLAGKHVVLATSTHMLPVAGIPWESATRRLTGTAWRMSGLHPSGCTCAQCQAPRGSICQAGVLDPESGKLSAPREGFSELARRFDYVLVEADGSKRLPLKAHADWEPVIPRESSNVVWVVGASGFGKPIGETVHRPELFCKICESSPCDIATPERVAVVLQTEMARLHLERPTVLLNQVDDDPTNDIVASRFQTAFGRPIIAGSLHAKTLARLETGANPETFPERNDRPRL